MLIIDFIKDNLFWIVLVLAIAIIWFVYSKLEPSTKISLRKFFSGKVLTAVALGILWIVWYYQGGSFEIKTANFWVPIFSLILIGAYNYIGGLKYETQQVVCANGFHGSYSKPPKRVKGFLIFAIDSFNAGGLSWDYAGRVLVLREETTEFCDEGAISISRPAPCNTGAFELEPEVKHFIENNRFLKGKNKQIFYGWFDDLNHIDYEYSELYRLGKLKQDEQEIMGLIKKEFNVKNPKISTLFFSYLNLNKALNKQTENFDSVVESTEKGVEHHKRIKDAYIERGDKPNSMETGHEEY